MCLLSFDMLRGQSNGKLPLTLAADGCATASPFGSVILFLSHYGNKVKVRKPCSRSSLRFARDDEESCIPPVVAVIAYP